MTNFVKCMNCENFYQYNGGTTSTLQRHICNPQLKQPRIDHFVNQRKQISKADNLNVRNAVTNFVIRDLRPFNVMEGEGMINMLGTMVRLGSKYPWLKDHDIKQLIPCRKTIHGTVLDKAEQARVMIRDVMKKSLDFPGGFACTTDIWTDDYKHRSYLCITLHANLFEDGKVVRKRFIISLNELDAVQKTHDVIYAEVKSIFESYDVLENDLVEKITFTTDRGSNVKKAFAHMTRLNCVAHSINNLVEYMCKSSACEQIVKDSASLVKYMKSTGMNLKLRKSLKSYCETRWNTVFDMLSSIHQNYTDIVTILSEKERISGLSITYKVARISRVDVLEVTDFLELFKSITDNIQGDKYVTIPQVWPSLNKIQKHLNEHASKTGIVGEMVENGQRYIFKNETIFMPCIEHKVAVFLHPLLKQLGFASSEDRQMIYEYIRQRVLTAEQDTNLERRQTDTPLVDPITKSYCLFSDFLASATLTAVENTTLPMSELDQYIQFKVQVVII